MATAPTGAGDPLSLLYQPISKWANGFWTVRIVEALRADPRFLQRPEVASHLVDLDIDAVVAATKQCLTWHCQVSVNASLQHLQHDRYADGVLDALAQTKFPPQRLLIEIIESDMPLISYPGVQPNMLRLAKAGVRFLLDDVGDGYLRNPQHVLQTLQTQPRVGKQPVIAGIKLARGVVNDLGSTETYKLAAGYIRDAKRSGAKLFVAEGIEDVATLSLVNWLAYDCGVEILIQGYLVSPKIEATELVKRFLSLRRTRPRGRSTRGRCSANCRRYRLELLTVVPLTVGCVTGVVSKGDGVGGCTP